MRKIKVFGLRVFKWRVVVLVWVGSYKFVGIEDRGKVRVAEFKLK